MKGRKKKLAELICTGEHAYFAASNSRDGFYSYYGECFGRANIQRLFAIKGGPGTGKSRFLREVADFGQRVGFEAEMIYCSSDPHSLDGVILTRDGESIALLDSTAPHIYEPTKPGFRDELINLGDFWDGKRLVEHRSEIEERNRQKKEAYRMAYRYLSAYGNLSDNRRQLTVGCFDAEALFDFAEKQLKNEQCRTHFSPSTMLMNSVGMRGTVGVDTFFAEAHRILAVPDCHGAGELLMKQIFKAAKDRRLSVAVSRDPILPDVVDGLFFKDSKTAFSLCSDDDCPYPHRRLSLHRFVNAGEMKQVKEEVRSLERLRRAMRSGAEEQMAEAGKIHFQLEQIYGACMDFRAKEEFTKSFCRKLFLRQK